MYYPKSQIQEKYTNGGEFTKTSNNQEYIGSYFDTSDGNSFAGTPQNPISLQPITTTSINTELEPVAEWTVENTGYQINTEAGLSPQNLKPQPTQTDIENGVFPRFFVKKRNESVIFEINREQYDMIQNKSTRIQWQLYQSMRIDWVISGDKNQVFNTNRNAARALGIETFFKGDFTKYLVI